MNKYLYKFFCTKEEKIRRSDKYCMIGDSVYKIVNFEGSRWLEFYGSLKDVK